VRSQVAYSYLQGESTRSGRLDDETLVSQVPFSSVPALQGQSTLGPQGTYMTRDHRLSHDDSRLSHDDISSTFTSFVGRIHDEIIDFHGRCRCPCAVEAIAVGRASGRHVRVPGACFAGRRRGHFSPRGRGSTRNCPSLGLVWSARLHVRLYSNPKP